MCKKLRLFSLLALCLLSTRCPGPDAKKCDPLVDNNCQPELAESTFHSSLVTIQSKLAKECSPPVKEVDGGGNNPSSGNTDKYFDIRVFNTNKARTCYKIWQDTSAISDLATRCKRYHEITSDPFLKSAENACTENFGAKDPNKLNADWDYSNPARYGKVSTSADAATIKINDNANAAFRCYSNDLLGSDYNTKYRGHYCESGPSSCTASQYKNATDITDGRECPGRCVKFKEENDKQCIQSWPTTNYAKEVFKVCNPNSAIHCVINYKGKEGRTAQADTCLKYAAITEDCNPNANGKPKCSGEGQYLHCVAKKDQDMRQPDFVGTCQFFATKGGSCSVDGKEHPKCDPNGEALHCVGEKDGSRQCQNYAEAGADCSDNAGMNKLPMCNPDTSFCDIEDKFLKKPKGNKNPVCVNIGTATNKCFLDLNGNLATTSQNIQANAPFGVQRYSQCGKDLVCMPSLKSKNENMDNQCLPKIKENQECDVSDQCESGLQCGYSKTAIKRANIATISSTDKTLKKICLGQASGPASVGDSTKMEIQPGDDCGVIKELIKMDDPDKVTDLKYMELEPNVNTINMADTNDPKTSFNVNIACADDVYDDRHNNNNGQDAHGAMYCAIKDQEKIFKINGTDVTRNLNMRQRCYRLVTLAGSYCDGELTGDKTADTDATPGKEGVLADPTKKFICGYAKTTGNSQDIYKPMKCENKQCKVQEYKIDPPKELEKCLDPVLEKATAITPPR